MTRCYTGLKIESFRHKKTDPLPVIDFKEVLGLGVDPKYILVDIQRQVDEAPGDELTVFYCVVTHEGDIGL